MSIVMNDDLIEPLNSNSCCSIKIDNINLTLLPKSSPILDYINIINHFRQLIDEENIETAISIILYQVISKFNLNKIVGLSYKRLVFWFY